VHAFAVELATTDAERERGLMFRKELPDGQGMLFDFQRDQPVAFWMHNTYLSLDMMFIRSDGRIMRIEEDAKPESDDLIPSGSPVRAVLEVIGGSSRRLGIKPGDRVTGALSAYLPLPKNAPDGWRTAGCLAGGGRTMYPQPRTGGV